MSNYYFTFGSNNTDKNWKSLKNAYVKIEADCIMIARARMFRARESYWSFCYEEEDFLPQIKEYNLYELKLEEVTL